MPVSGKRYQRAKAHAKHAYYCECGRVVHGNGARAQHFFINGDRGSWIAVERRWSGSRPGHRAINSARYDQLHGHPLDHPVNGGSPS